MAAALAPDSAAPWFLSVSDRGGGSAYLGKVFSARPAHGAAQRVFFSLESCTQHVEALKRSSTTPEADAAPHAVPLHAALAGAAAAPGTHEWAADVGEAGAAKRLLDAKQVADVAREEATEQAAAAAGKAGRFSEACEVMQSGAADAADAKATRAAAAAVAMGSVPVFTLRSLVFLPLALPGDNVRPFRPWFFSMAQLKHVVSAAEDAAARGAGRRLLPAGAHGDDSFAVDVYESVAGCSLNGVGNAAQELDAAVVLPPIFVAELPAEQLTLLAQLIKRPPGMDDD